MPFLSDHRDELTDIEVPELQFVEDFLILSEDILGINPVKPWNILVLPGSEKRRRGSGLADWAPLVLAEEGPDAAAQSAGVDDVLVAPTAAGS